jgi:hypothetical protein
MILLPAQLFLISAVEPGKNAADAQAAVPERFGF